MMKKAWQHDNYIAIIAGVYILFSFIIKAIILLGYAHASETLTTTIENNDNNLMAFIFGYFFCGTVNSKNKPAVSVGNIENIEQGKN